MANKKNNVSGGSSSTEKNNLSRNKLATLMYADPSIFDAPDDENTSSSNSSHRNSSSSLPSPRAASATAITTTISNPNSGNSSPYLMYSPWSQPSPYTKSPWIHEPYALYPAYDDDVVQDRTGSAKHGLIGSLVREEGHIYSLAAAGDLLYTGSDSKNIRVWKNLNEFSGFKCSSGLVKAILVLDNKIFTGHQDGRIRVWRLRGKSYTRVGSLPTTRDLIKKSINPKNYVEVRRKHSVPWIKHFDAVSCMDVDTDQGLLYSGSWDRTLKVWRISDSKCLESVHAHDDALNAILVAFDGFVLTGAADGTVKAWRRELVGKNTRHILVDTLMKQDHALTSLAVDAPAGMLYAGSSDGLVNFWEREKHFMSYGGVLRGHKLAVLCLAVGGNLVLSGSADKSICVWRREHGGVHTFLTVLTGHSGPVKCLAVAEDDEVVAEKGEQRWRVYSGSLDKSVKVWRVSENGPRLEDTQGV